MATGSRTEFILWRWKNLVEEFLPSECGAGDLTATTFAIYRRTLQGPPEVPPSRDHLGVQKRPTKLDFELVASGIPALFGGTNSKQDRWHVHPEGQDQVEMALLITSYLDVREGDNLIIALDGLTYNVEASTRYGPVVRCFLNSGKAML